MPRPGPTPTRIRFRSPAFALAVAVASLALASSSPHAAAAELSLDFNRLPPGSPPSDYRTALTGGGPTPEWRVIQVEAQPTLPALIPDKPSPASETVLAQVSEDPTDERFPLLIYDKESFADFTATLRFRTVAGRTERMAGLAFRLVDERNYYVVRASSLGNTFRFYKFVDGTRSTPIGPEIRIPSGEWHTLEVACRGNEIRCRLNGREVIPPLNDTSFGSGKFALWTKSDSVSHFAGLKISYEALKTLPQRLVESALERYPRLLNVTVFGDEAGTVKALASSDPQDIGTPASDAEIRTLREGTVLAGRTENAASAVIPIRDRNGDPMFAVRLRMRSFAGQTDNNIAARAQPILQHLERMVGASEASRK